MSQIIEVKVPDIGDFAEVPVIELYVKVGDSIKIDDAIATLESDKATMDVPSTVDGVIKEVLVQLGAKVGEGSVLIKVETGGAAVAAPALRGRSSLGDAGCPEGAGRRRQDRAREGCRRPGQVQPGSGQAESDVGLIGRR